MQRGKPSIVILGVCGLLVALLAACPNPISSSKGGVLAISINNNINARTLLPAIDMIAASFTVSGTGPGGATFSQTTSGAPVTLDGLAFGAWSVTVNALNAAGTLIGSGQATVTVHTGQTAAVSITVVPLIGNGTLELTVTWTGSQVENASILATLTPPVGPSTALSFSVTSGQATYSSTTIPAGYQTLTVQLLDSGIPVMGAVEVVRIVAGQTTTGAYTFANVNQPGGSVQVNITPEMADPIPLSISGVPATVTVGGSMTATASVSDGTANVTYVWYLNGVSVGMGPSYSLPGKVTAGWYRLDVTAYAAGGTRAGSATASFQVTQANGSFLYVANQDSNAVSGYTIGLNGLIASLSAASFVAGDSPNAIAVTPNGFYLYVTNANSNTVSAYAIASDGLLTPLSVPTVTTGYDPMGIAVHPNGSFLYVTNTNSNSVSSYAIGSGGLLTLVSETSSLGTYPHGIAVTPNGSFLYVANSGSNPAVAGSETISAYDLGSGGLLTPLSTPTFAASGVPYAITVTPNGSFLYVTSYAAATVSAYAIGSGGLLTPLSIPTYATGGTPVAMTVTPNGSFLYIVGQTTDTVSAYAIGSDGHLAPLSTPTFATGMQTTGITVTPSGSFLYVTNFGSNTISAYAIRVNGILTPLSYPAFATGAEPVGVVAR